MFSSSDAPLALTEHIAKLITDIAERKREVLKRQEIKKCLEEEYRKKIEAIQVVQEKTRQLDDAVKQTHEVYLSQKEALERVKEGVDVLNQQWESKAMKFEKTKEEILKFRFASEEKLQQYRKKFENYMEVYRKFPGVVEYEQMMDTLSAIRLEEQKWAEIVSRREENVAGLQELKQKRKAVLGSLEFKSISEWGVALAKQHKEYVEEQRSDKEFALEIKERKIIIAELEQRVEERKKRKIELEQKHQKAENTPKAPMLAPPCLGKAGTKQKSYLDFSKQPVSYKDLIKLRSKSQASTLRASVPNLKSCGFTDKFKFNLDVGLSNSVSLLSRSKSLTELAKGSSGAAVDGNPPMSDQHSLKPASETLQKWLTSAGPSVERLKRKEMRTAYGSKGRLPTTIPVPKFEEHINMDENSKRLETLSCFQKNKESPTCEAGAEAPFDPLEKKTAVTAESSLGYFPFPDMCKSPEDDFKFMTHVYVKPAMKTDKSEGTSAVYAESGDNALGAFQLGFPNFSSAPMGVSASDFQFAVPSAAPPARGAKRKPSKLHGDQPKDAGTKSNFLDGLISTESAPEQESFAFGGEPFSFGSGGVSAFPASGYSFLGVTPQSEGQSSDGESGSGSNDFFSMGGGSDKTKTSGFDSLFRYGQTSRSPF